MVELNDVRYLSEALLKLLNLNMSGLSSGNEMRSYSYLLEMTTELDHRRYAKYPVLIHDQTAMLQDVEIALDQKQVRALLHR